MASEKRKRSTNFTNGEELYLEEELLVDLLVDKYATTIENKMTDAITWKQKDAAWKSLCLDFNAQSNTNRNEKTLKMKYEGLKKNLKKKYTVNKFEMYKTGGGAATECKYEDYEKKLLSILSINVEGLLCEVDSDRNVVNIEAASASAKANDVLILGTGEFNLEDVDITQALPTFQQDLPQNQDIIIAKPEASGVDLTAENVISQEDILDNIKFKTISESGKGKSRNTTRWTPAILRKPITKKLKGEKPKEQINNKFYMLADGRKSDLLKQQLIIAEKKFI